MRKLIKDKKGQLDNPILAFAIIMVALIIMAPFVMKLLMTTQAGMSAGFGNVSGEGGVIGQTNFNIVLNTGINFWDKIIIAVFFFSIIMLFVSAFLIDAHPFFVILYIFTCFMLILFAPNIISIADKIYDNANFATEVTRLSFMNTLRTHYAEFLVGIIVITGIIIYGKIAFMRRSSGGNGRR